MSVKKSIAFSQVAETDKAYMVIMHEPTIESFIASLHPLGSLYEVATTRQMITDGFNNMRRALQSHGISVHTVRDILEMDTDTSEKQRRRLESLAYERFHYVLQNEEERELMNNEELYLLSDVYKMSVLQKLTPSDLVDIILTGPVVKLSKSPLNTPLVVHCVEKHPLGNLVFCRDQQITTAKGVVTGKLNSPQRVAETKIMRFVFEKLGCPLLGQVTGEGRLEGGDFYPVNRDLALLGTGLRSNMLAARYLMDTDCLGTRRFGVVRDDFDQHQDRMHLDTVFNIVSEKYVVILEDICGLDSPIRRIVEEFVRDDTTGKYVKAREVEFEQFLIEEGYTLIKVSDQEQKEYMVNFVNIGNDTIIAVHKRLEEKLRAAGYEGRVEYVEFVGIKNMFGAAHCATQVSRVPPVPEGKNNGSLAVTSPEKQ